MKTQRFTYFSTSIVITQRKTTEVLNIVIANKVRTITTNHKTEREKRTNNGRNDLKIIQIAMRKFQSRESKLLKDKKK